MTDQYIKNYKPLNFEGEDLDDLLSMFPKPLRSHCRRVGICSSIMAEQADEFFYQYGIPYGINFELIAYLGGMCHDVGKLVTSACTEQESGYHLHPVAGARLLDSYRRTLFDNDTQADMVIEVVRAHHERPDGSGFPYNKKYMDISLASGICAVADALDYNASLNEGVLKDNVGILRYFQKQQGVLFSEAGVVCLRKAWNQLMEKYKTWNSVEG